MEQPKKTISVGQIFRKDGSIEENFGEYTTPDNISIEATDKANIPSSEYTTSIVTATNHEGNNEYFAGRFETPGGHKSARHIGSIACSKN